MWIFQKSPFLDFNPRSREGSDHRAYCFVDRFVYFNPRSREGSDVDTTFLIVFKIVISTHAPARGATAIRFQSAMLLLCISTHAPARGATAINIGMALLKHISTHAPARGATVKCLVNIWDEVFQPTLPRGERPLFFTDAFASLVFQPTLPRGERPQQVHTAYCPVHGFQPTLPRGERRHWYFPINY